MSGGPLEALLREQVNFNKIVMDALTDIKGSVDRMMALVREVQRGDLVVATQTWRPILDDTPVPEQEAGCGECFPRIPASELSEAYTCTLCRSQFAPKMGNDGKWVWLWQ